MGVRLTADGRWYGLVVLGFTAASLNTGANLLLALAGGLLGVIAVNALLARRAVRGLVLGLDGPAQVAQGSPWRLTLRLSAANPRGCPLALRIRCPWSETPQALAGIPAGATLHLSLRPDAELPRGEHTLDGVQVACAAPFGLAEARAVARARHTLLVTPRVYPLRTGALERVERGEGNAAAAYLQGAEQRDRVRSLREFRAGDSPRAIHWRSSARRGSLVVREFERGVPERSCVVV
ncbi:MAG: DUF58 domain-containing protein, partial [Planctomycetes bacterium]|nr:DUF58 domain-containing protein [Planctomycetota bacterium]